MSQNELKTATAAEIKAWIDAGKADLYDIREVDEHAHEHIAGAVLHPLSSFDATKIKTDADKICVFHCGSAMRTGNAAEQLCAVGYRDIYHMDGGIAGWKQAGLAVTKVEKAPLPIMRQVQIIVGFTIVMSIMLGYWVSPLFNILAGIMGAGLCFAGVTGFCGMAKILSIMPWNRKNEKTSAGCCS